MSILVAAGFEGGGLSPTQFCLALGMDEEWNGVPIPLDILAQAIASGSNV